MEPSDESQAAGLPRLLVKGTFLHCDGGDSSSAALRSMKRSESDSLLHHGAKEAKVLSVYDVRSQHSCEATNASTGGEFPSGSVAPKKRPRPSKTERETFAERPIRFIDFSMADESGRQLLDSKIIAQAPQFRLYRDEAVKLLDGLERNVCAPAIIVFKNDDNSGEVDIGLAYAADFSEDALIVFDFWVLPQYCIKEIFHEIGRWWLIHLFSKFSSLRHSKDYLCKKYEDRKAKFTVCIPLPNAIFRPIVKDALESFCCQAASDDVTQRVCNSVHARERGADFGNHPWMQMGPFSMDEFGKKANDLWPTKPWEPCSDLTRTEIKAPVRSAIVPSRLDQDRVHSEEHQFGTLTVEALQTSGYLLWDRNPGLQLTVTFKCSEQYIPVVEQMLPLFQGSIRAVGTLVTKVQAIQSTTLMEPAEVEKILYREIAVGSSSCAEMTRGTIPDSGSTQWSATIALVPLRDLNAEILSVGAEACFECNIQVGRRVLMKQGDIETQLGSVSCIPPWTYSLRC